MVDKEKFKILLKAMKAVYTKPEFLPDQDAYNVWYAMLKDLDYEVLTSSIQHHMMTSPYPPTIADIRSGAVKFMPGNAHAMTEMEAWNRARKAIGNSNYHAAEEFEKLHPIIQKAVGSPANLSEWAMMDSSTVNSVIQSNFLKSYRDALAKEKELSKLSPAMRELMEKASNPGIGQEERKKIGEDTDDGT